MVLVCCVPWLAPGLHAFQSIPTEPAAYKPEEIQIDLSRGSCFGVCPVYSLQIFGDGTVKYRGSEHVSVRGVREAKISPTEVAKIVNEFLRARIFDQPANFRSGREIVRFDNGQFIRSRSGGASAEGPTIVLGLRLGSRTKSVRLDTDYPDELRHLVMLVDDVAIAQQWVVRK
jgi:hypothetical protein